MRDISKINVTIITGFLGAGKTTFINYLLKENPEIQFALVENEFGAVSIDTKLIKGIEASKMFELKGGCICCTITDEFELVLAELAERFSNVKHLLIETTGIADPAPVIRPFFRNNNLLKLYNFKRTICLVDALNFESQPEKEISEKQIAMADLVLINKSEKLPEFKKEKLQNHISQLNALAEINFSEFGVSPKFQLDSIQYKTKFFPEITIQNIQSHSKLNSQVLTFSKPLVKETFTDWLSYTLDIYKNEIYRVKGILCFENESYEFVFQGVGGGFEIYEGDSFISDNKSKIVFIGKLTGIKIEI